MAVLEAPELGLLGSAHATVLPSLLESDLGAAAAALVLETAKGHIAKSIADLRARGQDQDEVAQEVLLTAANLARVELGAFSIRKRQTIECTLDLAFILDSVLYVCHLGDGAVLLLRKGLVHKLTTDHVSQADHDEGERPARTQALGVDGSEPEVLSVALGRSDRVLVCSPYLNHTVSDIRMREASTDPSADGVTTRLLSTARERAPQADLAVGVMLPQGIQPSSSRPGSGRLETLARTPLFAYCTERELISLAGITRPARFAKDQVLFSQGDLGQAMYLLVAGRVRVERDKQTIAELGPGANFGEMALLDQPERSATITAIEPAEALVITREAFFALLKRDPTLAVKVLWNMLLRLSSNLRTTSERLAALEKELK